MRQPIGYDGLEGLPLKLAIVAVVMAISSPIIYGGLRAYEISKLEGQMGSEASAVAELAKTLYNGGVGNAHSLKISLRNGVTATVDYMKIGDSEGGIYESCIRYRVRGQPELTMLVESPSVPLRGSDGTELCIAAGVSDLMLECKATELGQYIEVRRAS